MKGSAVAQFKSQEISRHSRLLPQSYALQPYYENKLNLSFLTHSIDTPYSNVCPVHNTSTQYKYTIKPTRLNRHGTIRSDSAIQADSTRPDPTWLDRPGPARSDPAVLKTGLQPARATQPFPPFSSLRWPCRLQTDNRWILYVVLRIGYCVIPASSYMQLQQLAQLYKPPIQQLYVTGCTSSDPSKE